MQLKKPSKHPPFVKTSLPRYLTQEQVSRLFSAISSSRDRALFALIYHYGLRVEEATLLTRLGRLAISTWISEAISCVCSHQDFYESLIFHENFFRAR